MKRKRSRKNKHPTVFERVKGAFGKIGTLNIVLIFVGAYMVIINWQMLKVFQMYGAAPETAWCALIAALLGECGICGWIKTTKEKHGKKPDETEGQAEPEIPEETVEMTETVIPDDGETENGESPEGFG